MSSITDKLKAEIKELKAMVKELKTSSKPTQCLDFPYTIVTEFVTDAFAADGTYAPTTGNYAGNTRTYYSVNENTAYSTFVREGSIGYKINLPFDGQNLIPGGAGILYNIPNLIAYTELQIQRACDQKAKLQYLLDIDGDSLTPNTRNSILATIKAAEDAVCVNERALVQIRCHLSCLTPCKVDCKCH